MTSRERERNRRAFKLLGFPLPSTKAGSIDHWEAAHVHLHVAKLAARARLSLTERAVLDAVTTMTVATRSKLADSCAMTLLASLAGLPTMSPRQYEQSATRVRQALRSLRDDRGIPVFYVPGRSRHDLPIVGFEPLALAPGVCDWTPGCWDLQPLAIASSNPWPHNQATSVLPRSDTSRAPLGEQQGVDGPRPRLCDACASVLTSDGTCTGCELVYELELDQVGNA